MERFADVLGEIMRRRYIAEIDIARELGVSPALVTRWVRGTALPAAHDVTALRQLMYGHDALLFDAAAAGLPRLRYDYERRSPRPLCESERELLNRLPTAFRETFAAAFAGKEMTGI